MLRRSLPLLTLFSASTAWVSLAACTAKPPTQGNGTTTDTTTSTGTNGTTTANNGGETTKGDLDITGDGVDGSGNGSTFPADPIIDGAIDAAEYGVFDADPGAATGGVCVHEPHLSDANGPGAKFPKNWLRPRFRWSGSGSETIWEIRLKAPGQKNDLKVYTRDTQWIMPQELWTSVAEEIQDTEITVYIRGSGPSGMSGQSGSFTITEALAGGSMVFWGTESSLVAPGTSRLYGFTMGDEAVVDTLATDQVTSISGVLNPKGTDLRGDLKGDDGKGDNIAGFDSGKDRCIGCHSATPDGKAMIFTDDYPWDIGISSVEAGMTGTAPDYVSAQARNFLNMPFLGTGMMLPTAFAKGDRTLITTMGRRDDATPAYMYINYGYATPMTFEPNIHDLIWIDLQTTVSITTTLPAATGDGVTGLPAPWAAYYTGQDRIDAAAARGKELSAAKGTAWGVMISEGTSSISNPTPAKLSDKIAYSVSESSYDGHPDWHANTADIKVADITSPKGTATGTPVAGASDPTMLEYYPAFSPDDQFIAFNRAPAPTNKSRCPQGKQITRTADPAGSPPICDNYSLELGENPDGPYYNRKGEIFIVPSAGGTPHRLRGNDPVTCGGEVSPGVLNSWPKWSSAFRTDEVSGKVYYFVIFSSARDYPDQFELAPTDFTPPVENKSSQLYMSTVEYDPATGTMTSYGAIYLWNQNYLSTGDGNYTQLKTANLTPAWEDFSIPEVPPVDIIR